MAKYTATPTGREVTFKENEIIVSKTDLKGRITYANDIFLNIAGYTEAEVLGRPHSLVRHPSMPRCVFQLLWDVIQEKREIFAYVKNMAKNGDHYWVFAHVTPSFDAQGQVTGYHSNRRVARRESLARVEPLYAALLKEETRHGNAKEGQGAGHALLMETVRNSGMSYGEFIFTL